MNFARSLVPSFRTSHVLLQKSAGAATLCRAWHSTAPWTSVRCFSQGSSDSSHKTNIPPPPFPSKATAASNAPIFEPPFPNTVKPQPLKFQSRNIPAPNYDPKLLEELGIEKADPLRIAAVLAEENLTIGELKMLVDMKMHLATEEAYLTDNQSKEAKDAKDANEFDASKVMQLNPKRMFYPGQTYNAEDLSPETVVDFGKLRAQNRPKGCPLGGKKGPKIDFANVALLSRFVTDTGRIIGRRKSRVCAKKQRELRTAIKRARFINLLPYLHKLPEFMKKDAPPRMDF